MPFEPAAPGMLVRQINSVINKVNAMESGVSRTMGLILDFCGWHVGAEPKDRCGSLQHELKGLYRSPEDRFNGSTLSDHLSTS